MVAENSNSFGDIIVKKLIAEIAQAEPRQRAGNSRGRQLRSRKTRGPCRFRKLYPDRVTAATESGHDCD
jgi:hypothetical protein